MSDITPSRSEATGSQKQLVLWSDPVQTIYSSFMRGLNKKKVSLDDLLELEREKAAELKDFIFEILKELARAPIDEVELLMILLALHTTSDVVNIKWRRTAKGQAIKETYVEAKKSFLRNGIIDKP